MADKPKVKAPQKRTTPSQGGGGDQRRLLIIGGALAVLVVVAIGGFFLLGAGGSGTNADDVRAALEAADCTMEVKPAVPNVSDHSDFPDPDGTSTAWNTDPPTSGPHYGVTLIYGAYTDPPQIGRVVHNLEHGAVYILYGDDVPEATVTQLKGFYDQHENGTILAPYPKLGDKIALGAWYADGLPEASSDRGSGILATCTAFDEDAFAAFFDAFQFKGPESSIIPPSSMTPGSN
jgi:Protein of unknown function (DUF3105)